MNAPSAMLLLECVYGYRQKLGRCSCVWQGEGNANVINRVPEELHSSSFSARLPNSSKIHSLLKTVPPVSVLRRYSTRQLPRSRQRVQSSCSLVQTLGIFKMSTTSQSSTAKQPQVLDCSSPSKFPAFIAHEPRMILGEGIHYRPSDKTLHCCVIKKLRSSIG